MKYLLLLFVTTFLAACTNFSALEAPQAEEPEAEVIPPCAEGVATDGEDCLVSTAGSFVYSSSYGGRGATGSNVTLNEGDLNGTLPTGWYSGKTVSIADADLSAANIADGINIFGVIGQLTGSGPMADCPGTGLVASSCTAKSPQYYYTTAYGGRNNACPLDTPLSSACWLAEASGKYINRAVAASCASTGQLTETCNIPTNNYWYTSAYGGRSAICAMGTNTSPCWTNANNVNINDDSCVDNSYNATACATNSNRYVYTVEYGARDVVCTNNSAGNCWFSGATKSEVASDLVAGNIRNGITIFGVTGTYTGTNLSWPSSAHRTKATTQITYADEKVTAASLPAGYSTVPRIDVDNEGGSTNAEISSVDRTGWGATTCGTSQNSVALRIGDCAVVFGANATWDGALKGNAGQVKWELVSRSGDIASGKGQEVWRDSQTGLLWSSLVSTNLNWCKASGSSNSLNFNISAQLLNEDDPADICDQQINQNQGELEDVISACAQFTGFTNTATDIVNTGKSNLSVSSTPKVAWRLPSMYDYAVANKHGLRFVLPDAGVNSASLVEWTATVASTSRAEAFVFNSKTGARTKQNRIYLNSVRCVGR